MKKLNLVFSLFLLSILFFACGDENQEVKAEKTKKIYVGKIIKKPEFYISYGSILIIRVETEEGEKFDVVKTDHVGIEKEKYRKDSTHLALGEIIYFRKVYTTHKTKPGSVSSMKTIPVGVFVSYKEMPIGLENDIEKGEITLL